MAPQEFTGINALAMLAHELERVRQFAALGWDRTIALIALEGASLGAQSYAYWGRTLEYQCETLESKAQIVGDYVAYRESNGAVLPSYITAAGLQVMLAGAGLYE